MNNIGKIKSTSILIIALITTISLSIVSKYKIYGNDFKWIIILIVLYIVFHKATKTMNKRLTIVARNI